MRRCLALTAALFFCLPAVLPALAQAPGFRIGEGAVHPRFTLGAEYSTNVNRSDKDQVSDLILHFTPGVGLDVPSDVARIVLNGEADYQLFLGTDQADTKDFSHLAGKVLLDLALWPKGFFTLTINDNFVRTDDPLSNSLNQRFGSIYNRVGGMASLKPGGGALRFDLGYSLGLLKFDADSGGQSMDTLTHETGFLLSWRFFPRTSWVLSGDAQFPNYDNKVRVLAIGDNKEKAEYVADNREVKLIRAQTGLVGQFSSSLLMTVKAGYGDTLAKDRSNNQNYASVVGIAELTYYFTTNSLVTIGFLRGVDPTAIYGFYGTNRPYFLFSMVLADRYSFALKGSLDLVAYGRLPAPTNNPSEADLALLKSKSQMLAVQDRSDMRVRVAVPVQIAILRWMYFDLQYETDYRKSDVKSFSYMAHNIFGGLRFEY